MAAALLYPASTDSWSGEQRSTFKEKGEVEEFQCAPAAGTSFLHIQFLQYLQYLFAVQNETLKK